MQRPVGFPIINVHSHYHPGEPIEQVKERARLYGIRWYVMSCLRPVDGKPGNRIMQEVMEKHGDFIAALYHLDPDTDRPESIRRARRDGFVGLKVIGTLKPYDSTDYYPFYEAAEEEGMPILFHTGFLSVTEAQRRKTVSMLNMQPARLDTIARAFPGIKMVGAHLGAPWYQEAVAVAIFHPNIYFDLSGGAVRAMSMPFFRRLFATRDVYFAGMRNALLPPEDDIPNPHLVGKMMFGTDNPPPDTLVAFTQRLLDGLGATDDVRRKVWYRNASRVFGLEV